MIAGVDEAWNDSVTRANPAFGTNASRQQFMGLGTLSGNDISTDTSGHQDEYFDQQANSTDIRWTVNDQFSIKYIFGYTDYFYDRTTDFDLSSNTNANGNFSGDQQFYVSQETEYVSHELQFFNDWNDQLTTTTGLFYYQAAITQRGKWYDSNNNGIYTENFNYAAAPANSQFLAIFPKVGLFTAKQAGLAARAGVNSGLGLTSLLTLPLSIQPDGKNPITFAFGRWQADNVPNHTSVAHSPLTTGNNFAYQDRTEREAFALYSQSVYTFNEHFALTLGARWARDQLNGEENLFSYTEQPFILNGALPLTPQARTAMNIASGALNPDGTVADYNQLRTVGVPASQSLWRQMYRKDDKVTGRINLDWTPNDKDLIYFSVTTGYRSGGFNLFFFSENAKYKPEQLTAYELGYKGEILDGTMQINSAVYYYDYKDVHTFAAGPDAFGGYSSSVFAVPAAEMIGWDIDTLWLVNQRITLGATFSYTHSEYTQGFDLVNVDDAQIPTSLFPAARGDARHQGQSDAARAGDEGGRICTVCVAGAG